MSEKVSVQADSVAAPPVPAAVIDSEKEEVELAVGLNGDRTKVVLQVVAGDGKVSMSFEKNQAAHLALTIANAAKEVREPSRSRVLLPPSIPKALR